jgi:hypothetical protein
VTGGARRAQRPARAAAAVCAALLLAGLGLASAAEPNAAEPPSAAAPPNAVERPSAVAPPSAAAPPNATERPSAAEPPSVDLAALQALLGKGAFSEVIDQLEQWSDQGLVHPTLSFDRGVAYLGRAESSAHKPSDLGQAAAAFEETLALDPSDDEARVVLGRIRETISERRAKEHASAVVARPRLLRAFSGLVGDEVWAASALLGSLLLGVGLAGRLFTRSHEMRLGGAIAAVAGAFLLLLGGGMAGAEQHLRRHFAPAVVIVEEARLLDAEGRPVSGARGPSALDAAGDRVPEGSLVYIAAARGGLVQVEWGDERAWLNAAQVRRLATAEGS